MTNFVEIKNLKVTYQTKKNMFGGLQTVHAVNNVSLNIYEGEILAIAGESGIPGKLVGTIDMFDKYTFVEVPREVAKDVLHGMKNVKIKGKNIHVEIANKK